MLTESFRRKIGSVLFATASFWEGVDVPGEALSCLVLTRLPFAVPGEPLAEARVEDLRARGLDPFDHLIVPQAVIRFRQGFGRLIRSKTDRGAVLICDRRVIAKRYGRRFLASLPTANVHDVPSPQLLAELREFFKAS
jgi:ATP-dependent DNA helicase DinG